MNVPDWATIDSDFELNYLVNINSDKDFNCHYLREDQVAVIRECNTDGTLCDLRQKKMILSLGLCWKSRHFEIME